MFELLLRFTGAQALKILSVSAVAGFLAAAVVVLVNAASVADGQLASLRLGLSFLAVLGVMYACQRLSSRWLVASFEEIQRELRDSLSERLLRAPLRVVESIDAELTRVTGELAYLGSTLEAWVSGIMHLIFLICVTVMVALISVKALVVWCVTFGAAAWFLRKRLAEIRRASRGLGAATGALANRVQQLLDGFVQIKLDGELAEAVVEDILAAKDRVYANQGQIQTATTRTVVGAATVLYVLGRFPAAFADPSGIGLGPEEGYELVSLIELSMGPLLGFAMSTPQWLRAEAAARGILEVLDALGARTSPLQVPGTPPDFGRLALRDALFAYSGKGGFTVGPVDIHVERGELVFITGGNGSGKTTLMKMLLGVYPLDRGVIEVDGAPVRADAIGDYQALFSVILSRQHLLRRLYGLAQTVDADRVDALLERFGIAGIVRFVDGAFDRLDLSTGQRMRLAMVIALLEERPVCLFDEWTANQDPETTRFYYDTLLPELVAAGKTVVAVSHDARFFDRADRVLTLVDGRVVALSAHEGL